MAPHSGTHQWSDARFPTTPPLVHQCDLCGERRHIGSVLFSRSGARDEMMWVCDDCQNKLARCVDDEGTLGG